MPYKQYSDSYLLKMNKKEIIDLLRVAEHNFFATEEGLQNSARFGAEILAENAELKKLLKAANDAVKHNMNKSCHNCKHFTSNHDCDIGKYLYGTGEKECEWEWKHADEVMNLIGGNENG